MKNNLEDYLKKNHRIIKSGNDMSIIDSDIENHKIFLIGENHGVKSNVKYKMKFLKYFKEKTDFKYLICELPASMTYFLNLYFKSGDEDILKEIYQDLKGTDAWNRDEYNFWIDLYHYNKKFPKDRKIIPMGIDIEHQPRNAIKFIKKVLEDSVSLSEEIIKSITKLENADKDIDYEDLKILNKRLYREVKENKKLYKDISEKDCFLLKHINRNILNMVEVYSSNNFQGVRDNKMYDNFLKLTRDFSDEKYFGQIGLSHIFQRSFPAIDWFASSLRHLESKFKGKVLSIAYTYIDCKYLYPTNRRDYTGNINTMDLSIGEFKPFLEDGDTIFRLNGKDSPFSKELIWPLKHKFPNGGVTEDYIQYLIVIKDSHEMLSFD